VIGNSFNTDRLYAEAAKWHWNGSSWDKQVLGALPGTFTYYGTVIPRDITADGGVIVGGNAFDWYQWAGFIWTEETGMVDVDDFLTDNGVTPPPNFDIQTITAISDDGTVMVGTGQDTDYPFMPRSFRILNVATGIDDVVSTEASTLQMSAHPNPANRGATLSFSLEAREDVSMCIYDISGRLVAEIDAGPLPAGPNEMMWDGRDSGGEDVASGIYLCRLDAGDCHATGKVTVLR